MVEGWGFYKVLTKKNLQKWYSKIEKTLNIFKKVESVLIHLKSNLILYSFTKKGY